MPNNLIDIATVANVTRHNINNNNNYNSNNSKKDAKTREDYKSTSYYNTADRQHNLRELCGFLINSSIHLFTHSFTYI